MNLQGVCWLVVTDTKSEANDGACAQNGFSKVGCSVTAEHLVCEIPRPRNCLVPIGTPSRVPIGGWRLQDNGILCAYMSHGYSTEVT